MRRWLHERVPDRAWDNITVFFGLLAVAFLAWGFFQLHQTSVKADRTARQIGVESRERDRQIQESRISSCRHNYRSVEAVALFFFPPAKSRDARQRKIALRLHRFIQKKIRGCPSQIRPAIEGG